MLITAKICVHFSFFYHTNIFFYTIIGRINRDLPVGIWDSVRMASPSETLARNILNTWLEDLRNNFEFCNNTLLFSTFHFAIKDFFV